MTGQNFVDEDTDVEKAIHMGNAKRMRISAVSTPSNDRVCFYPLNYHAICCSDYAIDGVSLLSISCVLFQLVPVGKFPANADVSSSEVK